jgi:CubicO group peptidase (beta-lactamase class C family)
VSESLVKYIEEQQELWQVQGLGVAIVKGDEAIISKGFGLRDVENSKEVTGQTLFAIGSSSKAFTSTLIGALVDDGLIEWDKPVRHYIPKFRMFDQVATEHMTVRDLLCHRSGLPRHDLLWYNNLELTRADIIDKLQYLEPSKTFREVWQYNNLMYITAGYLAGELLGKSWEEAVQQRLLEPLEMRNTNFSIIDLQKSDDHSQPYTDRDDKVIEIPFRGLDLAGPAGSINSCIDDMTNWVMANVNGGVHNGNTVISPNALSQLHAPTMVMPEGPQLWDETYDTGYALGWFLESYRGNKVVHHGGNIDGFSALVAFAPKAQIGVVVLTNMNGTMLPTVIAYRAFDELLGLESINWGERYHNFIQAMKGGIKEAMERKASSAKKVPPSHELEEYAGQYEHPGYGTFTITVENGNLVPDFNGLDLKFEHRHFDVWEAVIDLFQLSIPIKFEMDEEGNIVALTSRLESTVDPIRFVKKTSLELDDEMLNKLAGDYAMGPITLNVAVTEGKLMVSTMGGPQAELTPYRDLTFTLKEAAAQSLEFVLGDDGAVKELVVQPAGVFTPVALDVTAEAPKP